MAMRERNVQPGGAVCLNAIGRLARDESLGNPMIRVILQQNQKDHYALKASQNHLVPRSILARVKEQGLNAGPEPARCARRSDRPKHLRSLLAARRRFCTLVTPRLVNGSPFGPNRKGLSGAFKSQTYTLRVVTNLMLRFQ
jgi:hypothetical protein